MGFLHTHFLSDSASNAFLADLQGFWLELSTQPFNGTVLRHNDKVFFDTFFFEGVGMNQFAMSLVFYATGVDHQTEMRLQGSRVPVLTDESNRFTFDLKYDRVFGTQTANCTQLYEQIQNYVCGKLTSLCRVHKLSLLHSDTE